MDDIGFTVEVIGDVLNVIIDFDYYVDCDCYLINYLDFGFDHVPLEYFLDRSYSFSSA